MQEIQRGQALDSVPSHEKVGKGLLIGIAAPTCAGKTTILSGLRHHLGDGVAVLSFDEYDLYPSGSPALEEALKNGTINNWEDPSLFDCERYLQDLQRLKEGKAVTLLSRSRESLAEGVAVRTVTPQRFTFVEGIFVLFDERASTLFDRRFYIDIPTEEMVRRRLARSPEGSTDPWDSKAYIEHEMVEGTDRFVKPQRTKADVVLNGLQPVDQLVAQIIHSLT